jgi:large subunit ribosomal protein L4
LSIVELAMRTNDGNGTLDVSDAIFAVDYKPALIHQVVTAYLAGARAGTKAQRNRSRVQGGGSKPYRQKGTGRARAGTSRSPLWRSGGVTFAAEPKAWDQKVNRKMYRGALRSILSELVRTDRLIVLPSLELEAAKTKLLAMRLEQLGLKDALIVVAGFDDAAFLAARNIPGVDVVTAAQADPVSLVAFKHVVMTEAALRALENRLK